MPTSLRLETRVWTAASLGGENPQAVLRDRSPDMPVLAGPSLSPAFAATIGRGCGRRVLPYRLQDRYDRIRRPREVPVIVLENEFLRAEFLPELGGRLMSLLDKAAGVELLHDNPVFQPANLALRDAWFAGGIEWNIGQFGHAFHTCAPVFAAAINGLDGAPALRIYDFDRCKSLLWQLDFHLPPGARMLTAFTRVVNPTPAEVAMYWWTNIAVADRPGLRVLAPAARATYVDYGDLTGPLAYGETALPGLPTLGGADATYPANHAYINEFFFHCHEAGLPWQAALDAAGRGLAEASTRPLAFRKLFCWGQHQGARRWQEFLSGPDRPYVEIQAGLAPSQQHTVPMPAGSEWCWTQVFGPLAADPALVHHPDWATAWRAVDEVLQRQVTAASLRLLEERCRPLAEAPPLRPLHAGGGWGALERRRRETCGEPAFPPAFGFAETTLGPEQQRWLELLETGRFPAQDPAAIPGEWLLQPEWLRLLETALAAPANRHWYAWLHLGVMKAEAYDDAGARAAWEESLRLTESAWAHRNLAALADRQGVPQAALPHYRRAWDLAAAAGPPDLSFALEYLAALHAAGDPEAAWRFFQELPPALREPATIRLLAGKIALDRDDLDYVATVFDAEFTSIREGASDLTNLWFGYQAKRLAAATGLSPATAMAEARRTCPPPFRIDFRVVE